MSTLTSPKVVLPAQLIALLIILLAPLDSEANWCFWAFVGKFKDGIEGDRHTRPLECSGLPYVICGMAAAVLDLVCKVTSNLFE